MMLSTLDPMAMPSISIDHNRQASRANPDFLRQQGRRQFGPMDRQGLPHTLAITHLGELDDPVRRRGTSQVDVVALARWTSWH